MRSNPIRTDGRDAACRVSSCSATHGGEGKSGLLRLLPAAGKPVLKRDAARRSLPLAHSWVFGISAKDWLPDTERRFALRSE